MKSVAKFFNGNPLVHVWDWKDENGVFGHTARYDDPQGKKDVVPYFVRNGAGFKMGRLPDPHPLLGLDVLSAAKSNRAVFIVEGEKKQAALESLGLVAVTSIGGAGQANKSDWSVLQGRKTFYIVVDNDEPGKRYASNVESILRKLNPEAKIAIVLLPGLTEGQDFCDWAAQYVPDWNQFDPIPPEAHSSLKEKLHAIIKAQADAQGKDTRTAGKIISKSSVTAEEWPEPMPLDDKPLPAWPENVFPEAVEEFVKDVSRSTETPIELAAGVCLAVLATAAQKKYRVQVKADYFEPCNLWVVVALPPATRKTAVFKEFQQPLVQWEKRQRSLFKDEIREKESKRKNITAELDALRRKLGKGDREAIEVQIEELERAMPEVPSYPQLFAQDVTPQDLGVIMAQNHECMSILSDEGGIFDLMAGQYEKKGIPNLDVFLQAHAGSPIRVNRLSRTPIFMQNPALTFGLTPQPGVLRSLTKCREFRNRGLLARFLFLVPSADFLGHRKLDTEPTSGELRCAYQETVEAMLGHECLIDSDGVRQLESLHLKPESYELWREAAQNEIERQLDQDTGAFALLQDWGGKLAGAIIRIAGLLHICRYAYGKPMQHSINEKEMEAAIRIGGVLGHHGLKAFDMMQARPAVENAKRISRWIVREELSEFSKRDCHYAFKKSLQSVEVVEEALKELIEAAYIRRKDQHQNRPGRPSELYSVNPLIVPTKTTKKD